MNLSSVPYHFSRDLNINLQVPSFDPRGGQIVQKSGRVEISCYSGTRFGHTKVKESSGKIKIVKNISGLFKRFTLCKVFIIEIGIYSNFWLTIQFL